MLAGHFGLAAAVKAKQPSVPLWALMLSTQLLDVLFVPLLLTNVETIVPIGKGGYGEAIIHANYTHSLVGALLIAIVAGLLAWRVWGRNTGLVIGAVVFSHWLLDLLVHRADLPILPGNLGNLPMLGFGLWAFPLVSVTMELALIAVGGWFYFSSALQRAKKAGPRHRSWAIVAGSVTCTLLVLLLVMDFTGIIG